MARSEAWRMLIRSISPGSARPTEKESAPEVITRKARSLAPGERALESRMPSGGNPGGSTTAAATTGPASGPRPASSTPATVRNTLARARASKPSKILLVALRLLRGRGVRRLLPDPVPLLPDPGLLPGDLPEEEELRPADVALLLDLDLLDPRGVQREGPLDPHAVGFLPDLEGGGDRVAVESDHDPLEVLDPLLLPFPDPEVHAHRVPRLELREIAAQLRTLQFLEEMHRTTPFDGRFHRTRPYNLFHTLAGCQPFPEQVGAPEGGPAERLLPPPTLDFRMVSGEKLLRHGMPPELPGAGVLRPLEDPPAEGVPVRAFRVAQDAGEKPRDGVHQHQGGKLPAGQDIVPDRDLPVGQVVGDPLVHPLVPAADQDQLLLPAQLPGQLLGEKLPLGGEQDRFPRAEPLPDRLDPQKDRLRLHHHPPPASEGGLVGHPVLSRRELAQVVDLDPEPLPLTRPGEDAVVERPGEDHGKQGQDVDPHLRTHHPSGGDAVIRRPARSTLRTKASIMGSSASPSPRRITSQSWAGPSVTPATTPSGRPSPSATSQPTRSTQ